MDTGILNLILSIGGSVVSIGFVYGTLKTEVKSLKEEVNELRRNGEKIADVMNRTIVIETKMDIILKHFTDKT